MSAIDEASAHDYPDHIKGKRKPAFLDPSNSENKKLRKAFRKKQKAAAHKKLKAGKPKNEGLEAYDRAALKISEAALRGTGMPIGRRVLAKQAKSSPSNPFAKMNDRLATVLKAARKGEAPFTIITHIGGKVKKQEHTSVLQLVPAFVRTAMEKNKKKKAIITVEDKTGKVLYTASTQNESMDFKDMDAQGAKDVADLSAFDAALAKARKAHSKGAKKGK